MTATIAARTNTQEKQNKTHPFFSFCCRCKTSILHVHHTFYVHFFAIVAQPTSWIFPIEHFVKGVNAKYNFFLFICWTKLLSLWTDRIYFQKNLPLCDKFKDEIRLIKINKSGNYVFATDPFVVAYERRRPYYRLRWMHTKTQRNISKVRFNFIEKSLDLSLFIVLGPQNFTSITWTQRSPSATLKVARYSFSASIPSTF